MASSVKRSAALVAGEGPGLLGQLVGERLGAVEEVDARWGDPPVRAEQASGGERLGGGGPFVVGPSAVGLEGVAGEVVAGAEHHRRESVEADRQLGEDVAVAAELTEDRGGLPEDGQRFAGPWEGGVRGAEGAAGGGRRGGDRLEQRGRFVDVLSVEQSRERCDRALEPGGQGLVG